MPRILISGYYGFNNAGDDTVLDGIITALTENYNEQERLELAVLSNKPSVTADLFQIEAYNRWSIKEIRKQLRLCDLLIMGGGSLLQDVTSPRSVIYYLGITWLAKRLGKPVIYYAQGIGPINNNFSKYLMKHIVNKVNAITVRDYKSLMELQNIGVHAPLMYLTVDPALAMDPNQIDLTIGEQILEKYGLSKCNACNNDSTKILGISIRIWRKESAYLETVAKVADYMVEKGWKIVFIPMHHPMDIAPSQEVISKMRYRQQVILIDEQNINFRQIISIIGNLDYMIGMRLHAVILAGIHRIPFTAISYDPKIDRFLESLHYPKPQHVESLDYEQLITDITTKISNLEAEKIYLDNNIKQVKPIATETARLALSILKTH